MARLEWAMHMALHAEVRLPLTLLSWAAWRRTTWPSSSSSLILRSHCWIPPGPSTRSGARNQADEEVCAAIDLYAGGVSLEIRRWEDDVGFRRLNPSLYTFRATLAAGHSLAMAAEAALAVSQEFDCVAALHELLTDGVIIGFTLYRNKGDHV